MRALAFALATALAGCGSSPEPTFYALAPTPGAAAGAPLRTVRLRHPGLPGYLDRPEIVRRESNYRLGMTASDRWGEPLDAMLARVLAEDLQDRLPGSVVYTEDGAITAEPDATVEVDVRRFDVGADGTANLRAEVAVARGDAHGPPAALAVALAERPTAPSTGALVEAMSGLLGQLADRIALTLRAP
jgi:uncharacterized lipoprotein YmbA